MKCPICKSEVRFGAPLMPFCSERCRLIDLGKWSDESYRIPVREPAPRDEAESDE